MTLLGLASLLLYVASLFVPAIKLGQDVWLGWQIILWSPLAFLEIVAGSGGAIALLANPLYFFSIYSVWKGRDQASLFSAVGAFFFAAAVIPFCHAFPIIVDEAGHTAPLVPLLGYWLWTSAVVLQGLDGIVPRKGRMLRMDRFREQGRR